MVSSWLLRVWQNPTWHNRVDRHVFDRIRLDRMKVDRIRLDRIKGILRVWHNPTRQSRVDGHLFDRKRLDRLKVDNIRSWQEFEHDRKELIFWKPSSDVGTMSFRSEHVLKILVRICNDILRRNFMTLLNICAVRHTLEIEVWTPFCDAKYGNLQ